MTIEFRKTDPNDRARGKLAEGTLKFDDISYGGLGGCAITGFTLWEPTDGVKRHESRCQRGCT